MILELQQCERLKLQHLSRLATGISYTHQQFILILQEPLDTSESLVHAKTVEP
jgi:hypothetical protein